MINGIKKPYRWQIANQFIENIQDIVEAGLSSTDKAQEGHARQRKTDRSGLLRWYLKKNDIKDKSISAGIVQYNSFENTNYKLPLYLSNGNNNRKEGRLWRQRKTRELSTPRLVFPKEVADGYAEDCAYLREK